MKLEKMKSELVKEIKRLEQEPICITDKEGRVSRFVSMNFPDISEVRSRNDKRQIRDAQGRFTKD